MQNAKLRNAITIAFDDAYSDTYKHAVKYLTQLSIKSTIAVPSSLIGGRFENRSTMLLREIKVAISTGHEIASHTVSHINLLNIIRKNKEAYIREVAESKKELQHDLKHKIYSFVFPYIKKNQSRSLRLYAKKYINQLGLHSINRVLIRFLCKILIASKDSP